MPTSSVLLTGATGFVGGRLHPAMLDAGLTVRRASRQPPREAGWARLDVNAPTTLPAALEGIETVVYLVHGMADAGDYAARERAAAENLAAAATRAGVRHIVYLGGVAPRGRPTKHLKSRLATGEALRAGEVPVTELRAGIILGEGSASWHILRDLAVRLPAMLLPAWLQYRMEPIFIDDVVAALLRAVQQGPSLAGVHDLPGPEPVTGEELLARVSLAAGLRPYTARVPFLTPRLSAYWLRFVSGVDPQLARQLVEGLTGDLLAADGGWWAHWPEHRRTPLDHAIRAALAETDEARSVRARVGEWAVRRLGRRA